MTERPKEKNGKRRARSSAKVAKGRMAAAPALAAVAPAPDEGGSSAASTEGDAPSNGASVGDADAKSRRPPTRLRSGGKGARSEASGGVVSAKTRPAADGADAAPSDKRGAETKRRLPVMQKPSTDVADPGDSDLRFRLASFLRVSDNLVSKAVAAYDRLFSLERSDQSEIYLQMGQEFSGAGRLHEALRALRHAVRADAENATALVELGVVHVRMRAPVAAVQSFERAQGLGAATYRLQKFYAEALLMLERPEDAVRELEKAVRLAPESADAWYRFGNALDLVDNHAEAIEAFQVCVELDPDTIEYQQRLGFAFESAGRRSEAVKCFKRALALEHEVGEERSEYARDAE